MKKSKVVKIRDRSELRFKLEEAERLKAEWKRHFHSGKLSTKDNVEALRNYTALRGVVKTLQWALGNPECPLE